MYKQTLEKFDDSRGCLYPLEFEKLPFYPKRFFIISDVPQGEKRGGHAHYHTEQYLICLKGKIEVSLHDGEVESFIILEPMQGLLVPSLVWDSQSFLTGEDILLVLASTSYNREDYIESFSVFKALNENFINRS